MKYRADIDGLRTVAVLPVVIFHAGLGLPGGFVGVDVFFVISGFLITFLLVSEIQTNRFSIINFYERRARRIFPALFAMVFATTVAASFVMLPYDFEDFGKSVVATTLLAANIWFYKQEGYFTEAAELEPLLHAWSLSVEEQYYIVFPLLLLFAFRYLGRLGAVALILCVGLISFLAAAKTVSSAPEASLHLRAWELMIGSLLAIGFALSWTDRVSLPKWMAHLVSLFGLAFIIVPVFFYNPETLFPGVNALPPCLGAMLMIAIGGDGRGIGTRFLSLPIMTFVGKLSYSIYLWHWPVITLVYYKFGELTSALGLSCLAVAFVLAYLSWRFVEQPFRNRRRIGVPMVAFTSIGAMALSTGLGLFIWRSDGLPNRVDPRLLDIVQPAVPRTTHYAKFRHCLFVTPERAQNGDVCVRGAESVQPSFVFVGDSHAASLTPVVFDMARDLGIAGYQYSNPGLVPLPDVWRLDRVGTEDVDAFVAFVQERPSIETIIIARYWLHQMTGYTYRFEGDVWLDERYDGSGASYNQTATLNGLIRLSRMFPDREIVLLDDVPSGSEMHIRDQIRRVNFEGLSKLGLPVEAYQKQRASYEPFFEKLAQDTPNIFYRPVASKLCDAQLCRLFDGDTLLYNDGDHVKPVGALKLSEPIRDLLAEFSTPKEGIGS